MQSLKMPNVVSDRSIVIHMGLMIIFNSQCHSELNTKWWILQIGFEF